MRRVTARVALYGADGSKIPGSDLEVEVTDTGSVQTIALPDGYLDRGGAMMGMVMVEDHQPTTVPDWWAEGPYTGALPGAAYGYRHTLDLPPGCLCVAELGRHELLRPPPGGCPAHGAPPVLRFD